jgi:hypothetical protein
VGAAVQSGRLVFDTLIAGRNGETVRVAEVSAPFTLP